ncbi:signal peptidase I [Sinobacterium caligoides]|uniref:Signal peptidase I n=1 Tax=Sinobacterium caligoides TaxID=933926 RepID=A0A3N2DDY9_9GAMM|nr:signal peptidase I [Sinobacterium caligoides]ROR97878.1 signal peptidase I [Sinobacterium caligoides]
MSIRITKTPIVISGRYMEGTYMRVIIFLLTLVALNASSKEFIQNGSAMLPTVAHGESVEVNIIDSILNDSNRWDLVLFINPNGDFNTVLSRLVGIPGDIIDIDDNGLKINGAIAKLPSSLSAAGIKHVSFFSILDSQYHNHLYRLPAKLVDNECFILGDNTRIAKDSRFFGPVSCKSIATATKNGAI